MRDMKSLEQNKVERYVNNFFLENYNLSVESIFDKSTSEIVALIEKENVENIKNFADVLFLLFSVEEDVFHRMYQSCVALEFYQIYESRSEVCSLEVQSKIYKLKSLFF